MGDGLVAIPVAYQQTYNSNASRNAVHPMPIQTFMIDEPMISQNLE